MLSLLEFKSIANFFCQELEFCAIFKIDSCGDQQRLVETAGISSDDIVVMITDNYINLSHY